MSGKGGRELPGVRYPGSTGFRSGGRRLSSYCGHGHDEGGRSRAPDHRIEGRSAAAPTAAGGTAAFACASACPGRCSGDGDPARPGLSLVLARRLPAGRGAGPDRDRPGRAGVVGGGSVLRPVRVPDHGHPVRCQGTRRVLSQLLRAEDPSDLSALLRFLGCRLSPPPAADSVREASRVAAARSGLVLDLPAECLDLAQGLASGRRLQPLLVAGC